MYKKFYLKSLLLLAMLLIGAGNLWADDVPAYTLTPASGSNNSYAGNCDITINGITWNLTGNSTFQPWRIGGKSLTEVDRALYSKTAISDNITKIEVTHGAASSITVNSWTVLVSKNSDFSNPVSTLTPTFAANATTTITRPDGVDWSNCYFKFVYNVTVSGDKNKFIEFSEAKFYKESGSSAPVQLDAPTLTATASNNEVSLEWDAISNASSYTIQYADNNAFTGATTIDNATSPKVISGLTNGTTYYFKAMTVGDGTNYLSSDYGNVVSATPANVSKITITQDNLTEFTNTYAWYDWSAGGVSGKAYAYKSGGMQFNSSKTGYWIYNSTAIPGIITSVKMVKASGTDRSWTLRAGTSEISTTTDGTQIGEAQTVGTNGATWSVDGAYNYFCLYVSGGSTVISSIEITYSTSTDPIIVASDPATLAYNATEGEFGYSITNPTSATLNAVSNAAWITNVAVDGTNSKVTFSTSTNTGDQRQGTITLSYTGATDKVITITQAAAPQPSINADDVNIAYDATNGSIAYTIENPANGTISASVPQDSWVTLGGETASPISFTCAANSETTARTAIVTMTYTYNTNETVTKDVTITQAGAPMTIAQVRAQGTGSVVTKGIVTSCVNGDNNGTAYIQDATAAICVYNNDEGFELTVGDEVLVEGTLSTYHSLLEIASPTVTVLSSGNTVTPTLKTIAEINTDYAGSNALQGLLVKIENATVTAIDGDNTTIAQGNNTITVHKITGVTYGVDDVISLTGNIGCYDGVQIANPTFIGMQPTIKYYIAGSWDNNSWANGMVRLTKNNEGKYTTEKAFELGTTFKVVKVDENNPDEQNNKIWYGGETNDETYGIHSGWHENIALKPGNAGKNFKIEPAGTYTFTVNVSNNTPTTITVTGFPAPAYYLKGSFDNWGNGKTFVSQGNGVYSLKVKLAADDVFKVVDENDSYYSNNDFSENNCTNLPLYTDNNNMTTGVAGNFVFTLYTASSPIKLTVGWPKVYEGNMFVKVTSDEDFTDGAYLIVYEDGNVAFDGSRETLDAVSNIIPVTINDNKIEATETLKESIFCIEGSTIESASGLYIGQKTDANGMATSGEDAYTNTISIDEDGNADVISEGGAYLRYNATSGQTRFRYFKSSTYTSQKAIQLYKLVHEVTFSENDTEATTITANDNKLVNATLERTLSNTYWSTFSVPFDVDADQVTSVLGEGVGLRKFQGSEGTVIKFQETTTIEAGHAYLVKPAKTVTNPVFNGVTVVNTTGETDDDSNGYGFVGTVIKKTLKTDRTELFLGTDAKFYYPASADVATMKGLRGYFVVPAGTETSKLSVDVEGSGIATSINSMNIEGMGDGNIYNLNGQRVNAPQKGLYIVNGKKVIIK